MLKKAGFSAKGIVLSGPPGAELVTLAARERARAERGITEPEIVLAESALGRWCAAEHEVGRHEHEPRVRCARPTRDARSRKSRAILRIHKRGVNLAHW